MGAAQNYSNLSDDELRQLLSERDRALASKEQTISHQERIIKVMEEALRLQKLRLFGKSSEKSPDQVELFNEAEFSVAAEDGFVQQDAQSACADSATRKKKPGRKPLPADLPRVRIEHDLPDTEKTCECGCERVVIGEEISEQLDIIPATIQVLVNVRKKYACKKCESGVAVAPLPAQPISKSNASPGLLAHIVTSKYQDALPLHRQEAILQRQGIDIPRNTLANWMIRSGELIQPLINLLDERWRDYPVVHCDETPVQVLNEQGKRAQSQSYMWVRVGGPPTQPVRLFHYADSRRGDVAAGLLADYCGYVQTDDYAGYNQACSATNITQLGCWAHARRKLVEAEKVTAGKTGKANMILSMIARLYAIEKRARDLDPADRYSLRQKESVPQLDKIRKWLDNTLHSTLPKGVLGKALAYLDKNWRKLTVYTEDGRLNIDNNPAENAIRPFVLGRKNWLFSASVNGSNASANLYSLIETARANKLEPYNYLRYVFKELPLAQGVENIEALLPWNVSAEALTV
ncbi:IS66 family transposase [Pseudomaricurvus alcaniphilus]|uniref:IS66 family transposase n=1 Tax=Pseudomaricurvus alcaniphilus TaxID=1166482 RepID=UPI00140A00C1|nr:IS66 family transposase [Pseudomaricurvus alcaniphilus]NHN40011.1 IS66 family transposase [Pseudomaricurvus alcaniphilus]